ncbi:MAG TPA: tetratricopeptide repeat protein, partial [Flavobacteriales bacterium]|nr:tetratricopeptide repeat protein [Flavobacteriales bacterium]
MGGNRMRMGGGDDTLTRTWYWIYFTGSPAFAPVIRRTALLLIAFAGCLSCVAQDLDSLRAAWRNTALADSLRYRACYDLVWDGYLFSDPDSALLLAEELQTSARKRGSAQYDALAYDLQAVAWYVKGDLRKALSLYAISLPMHEARGDVGSMADVIGNMGSMHLYLGEHKEALALYEKALKVHAEHADTLAMANDINAMGAVYMARGEHGRAIEHYTRGLRMLHAIGNERGIATGLTNLGTVHQLQGDPRAALPRYAEAIAIAERLGDKDQMATILGEIGTCHEELGDSTNAMAAFQRSRGLNEELGDQRGVVTILNKMGALSMTMGRPSEAWSRFHEAMVIAKEHDLTFGHATALIGAGNAAMRLGRSSEALMLADRAETMVRTSDEVSLKRDAAELLYRLHRAAGRTQQALQQHEAYVLYRDSILREADQRETLHAQYAYDQERRALSDSLKHQSETHALNLAHAASLGREQQRRTWLMAAALIAAVVAAGIWWRLRHAERTNRTIRAAQSRVVEAERQRENEAVRTRIARDLHDEMGGELTKIG